MFYGIQPQDQAADVVTGSPGTGRSLILGFEHGFGETSIGELVQAMGAGGSATGFPLTKEQWELGGFARPGLQWRPGMTSYQAEVASDNYDTQGETTLAQANHPIAAGIGRFAGESLDPAYLLPVARILKPVLEARFASKIAIDAVSAASQMTVGQTAQETARVANDLAHKQGVDIPGALERIAAATAGGALFGAAGGAVAQFRTGTRLSAALKAAEAINRGEPSGVAMDLADAEVQRALADGRLPDVPADAEMSDLARMAITARQNEISVGELSEDQRLLLDSFIKDRGVAYAEARASLEPENAPYWHQQAQAAKTNLKWVQAPAEREVARETPEKPLDLETLTDAQRKEYEAEVRPNEADDYEKALRIGAMCRGIG